MSFPEIAVCAILAVIVTSIGLVVLTLTINLVTGRDVVTGRKLDSPPLPPLTINQIRELEHRIAERGMR